MIVSRSPYINIKERFPPLFQDLHPSQSREIFSTGVFDYLHHAPQRCEGWHYGGTASSSRLPGGGSVLWTRFTLRFIGTEAGKYPPAPSLNNLQPDCAYSALTDHTGLYSLLMLPLLGMFTASLRCCNMRLSRSLGLFCCTAGALYETAM